MSDTDTNTDTNSVTDYAIRLESLRIAERLKDDYDCTITQLAHEIYFFLKGEDSKVVSLRALNEAFDDIDINDVYVNRFTDIINDSAK